MLCMALQLLEISFKSLLCCHSISVWIGLTWLGSARFGSVEFGSVWPVFVLLFVSDGKMSLGQCIRNALVRASVRLRFSDPIETFVHVSLIPKIN